MPGLVGLIRSKTLPILAPDAKNNPYAIAMKFPEESARLFDGELKLLLMDGLDTTYTFWCSKYNVP